MVYTGEEINPAKLFTLMTFVLAFPNAFQLLWIMIEFVTSSRVALERFQHFLLIEENDQKQMLKRISSSTDNKTQNDPKIPMVSLKNLCCKLTTESMEKKDNKVTLLENVNLDLSEAKLIAVIGKIGCGKSSLLNVILKELPVTKGELSINGSIALVSQKAWLFTGTIRDNIIFGKEYDEKWFNIVLRACALDSDLDCFAQRDLSYIGERGIKLSGGQRARVSLARAVYHNTDIYLLDDPLSALDSKIGSHVFEQCIKRLLSKRLRILVTHDIHYLDSVDQIVVMDKGSILGQGTYGEICASYPALEEMIKTFQNGSAKNQDIIKSHQSHKQGDPQLNNKTNEDDKQEQEDKAVGTVSVKTYWHYVRSGNSIFVLVALLVVCIFSQGMYIYVIKTMLLALVVVLSKQLLPNLS